MADRGNNLIRKVSPSGEVTTLAGGAGQTVINGTGAAAGFNAPQGIAVDFKGNVFVSDQGGHVIRKITPAGLVTTFAGSGSAGSANGVGSTASFNAPAGLAFDYDGNLYVADQNNNMIRKIKPDGTVSTFAGSTTSGRVDGSGTSASFSSPSYLTTDAIGNLYVSDAGNNIIRVISPDGIVRTLTGNQVIVTADGITPAARLNYPAGLAIGADGNLILCEAYANLVKKVITSGYNISPSLPEGLGFDAASGAITGTPTVSSPATTYKITALNNYGTSTATLVLDIKIPETPPAITSLSPTSAGINNSIAITGSNFTDVTAVEIGGASATYKVISPTKLIVLIPSNATGTDVKVKNAYGTGTFAGLSILKSPAISYSGSQKYLTGVPVNSAPASNSGGDVPNNLYAKTTTLNANLFQSGAVTVDASGNTFVAQQSVIYKVTPSGTTSLYTGKASSNGLINGSLADATFGSINAMAFDNSGNLYVNDYGNNAIRKITPAGTVSTYFNYYYGSSDGPIGSANFNGIADFAIDNAGNLFIADGPKIRKVSATGMVTTFAGSDAGNVDGVGASAKFSSINGLTVDDIGNIYVCDAANYKIRKVTPNGIVTTLAGSGSSGNTNGTGTAATFTSLRDIAVDKAGNLYIADNNLIRKLTAQGVVTTLIGNSKTASVDGIGSNASFKGLKSIATGADGNLYITDVDAGTLRKVVLTGYSISPDLPQGLAIDGSGAVTGNPTAVSPATDYTVTAYNASGTSSTNLNIAVSIPELPPVINSFTQANQNAGAGIIINGTNFTAATAVSIGGVPASSFKILSPTTIVAYSAPAATAGEVKITNQYGSASKGGVMYALAPAISYPSNLAFTAGSAISPVSPVNNGSAVPENAYLSIVPFAGGKPGYANGTGAAASFSSPSAMTGDQEGNIYVCDLNNNAIRKITPNGVVTTVADRNSTNANAGNNLPGLVYGTFYTPKAIVRDKDGNLYVAEYGNNLIRKITPQGVVSIFAGNGNIGSTDGTGTSAYFFSPNGMTIDRKGNLFVSDYNTSLIRKITPQGAVSTFAGGAWGSMVDGNGTGANFHYPGGLVADFFDNIYVADNGNGVIRKITPEGNVTVFAGGSGNETKDGQGTAAGFSGIQSLTIDPYGNLYAIESGVIRKISPSGNVTTLPVTLNINYQYQIFYDAKSGDLILAQATDNLIRRISLNGYSISPNLPAGLMMSNAGVITGTPTYVATSPLNFTVTARNANGASSAALSFKVGVPAAPKISYPGSQVFTVATTFTPVMPTNTGGGVPPLGYGATSTIAGDGTYNSVNGYGTNSSFTFVTGIAVASDGSIYVGEAGHPKIRRITEDGYVSTFTGQDEPNSNNGTLNEAAFEGVLGLTFASNGDLYATDGSGYVGYSIRKISNGTVSRLAGNPEIYGYADGTGTDAKFNAPRQIAIDQTGNLYVADQVNNRIRKITQAGVVTKFAGTGVAGDNEGDINTATFNNPDGICIDNAGNFYVADTKNNKIKKIATDGTVSTFAGNGNAATVDGLGKNASINHPTSIIIDHSGNFYLTEFNGNTIRKISAEGVVTTVAGNGKSVTVDGSGKQESFYAPYALAIANDDSKLYVAEYNGGVVRKVELGGYTIDKPLPDGLFFNGASGKIYGIPAVTSPATDYTITAVNAGGSSSTTITIEVKALQAPDISYETPKVLGINQSSSLYLTNKGGNVPATAYAFTFPVAGSGIFAYSDGNNTAAAFNTIKGMVSDQLGYIYVADQMNNRIRKITPDGVVSTYAGNGNSSSVDGSVSTASFYQPVGLGIDKQGNIYVAESYSGKVRKITTTGQVKTLDWTYYSSTSNAPYQPLTTPSGIVVDKGGNLYISDLYYNIIRKVTYSSSISPSNIISVFAGTGSYGSANGTGGAASFNQPSGLAIDKDGNIYVADKGNNLIRKITPAGVVSTFAGSGLQGYADGAANSAKFNQPTMLTFDLAGNLYVTDSGNNMIRMVAPDGTVTTFTGTTTAGSTNGLKATAKFNSPTGITIDPVGRLYVSDNNNVVRTISTAGYAIDSQLPAGLSFDGNTGIISGTPTTLSPSKNYNITAYNASGKSTAVLNLTISEKSDQKITFTMPDNATYGNADVAPELSSTNTNTPVTLKSSDPQILTIVNGKLHILKAGTVTVTASQAEDANHFAAIDVTRSITIAKASIFATVDEKARAVGKPNPPFAIKYQGFVNGDDASAITTEPIATTTANDTSPVGQYDVVVSGGASEKYTFTYQNSKLNVVPAATNFKVAATNVSCKGQGNGAINVTAADTHNYTAVLTGNGVNKTEQFTSSINFSNLAPGTYNVVLYDVAVPISLQKFDVTITEPKDIALYSTVNKTTNTVKLALTGGANYNIELNGSTYKTTSNTITLPLVKGANRIVVSTDLFCQGRVEELINLNPDPAPYPNPFTNILYVNLGEVQVNKAILRIFGVGDSQLKLTSTYNNVSGVVKLDVQQLPMGVYTLHVTTDSKDTIYKIIKQ